MGSSFTSALNGDYFSADKSALIIQSSAAMIALSSTFVLLRFLSRRLTRMPLLWDDWLIVVALPFALATAALPISGALYDSMGRHTLGHSTTDSLHSFLKKLYAFEITYTIAVAMPKFSMIALYLRVFPARVSSKSFITSIRVVTVLNGMWMTAMTLAAAFTCTPVEGFWLFEMKAQCFDMWRFFISSASLNIAIDVALIILPALMIHSLQLNLIQKLAVLCTFCVGILVTICSCLRLNLLISVSNQDLHTDPLWVLVYPSVWSVVEVNLSVVCACLPSMRPLIRYFTGHIRISWVNSSGVSHSSAKLSSCLSGVTGSKSHSGRSGARRSRANPPKLFNWKFSNLSSSRATRSTRTAGSSTLVDEERGRGATSCITIHVHMPKRAWPSSYSRTRSRSSARGGARPPPGSAPYPAHPKPRALRALAPQLSSPRLTRASLDLSDAGFTPLVPLQSQSQHRTSAHRAPLGSHPAASRPVTPPPQPRGDEVHVTHEVCIERSPRHSEATTAPSLHDARDWPMPPAVRHRRRSSSPPPPPVPLFVATERGGADRGGPRSPASVDGRRGRPREGLGSPTHVRHFSLPRSAMLRRSSAGASVRRALAGDRDEHDGADVHGNAATEGYAARPGEREALEGFP